MVPSSTIEWGLHSQQLWTAIYSPGLNLQRHLSSVQLPQVGWQESCWWGWGLLEELKGCLPAGCCRQAHPTDLKFIEWSRMCRSFPFILVLCGFLYVCLYVRFFLLSFVSEETCFLRCCPGWESLWKVVVIFPRERPKQLKKCLGGGQADLVHPTSISRFWVFWSPGNENCRSTIPGGHWGVVRVMSWLTWGPKYIRGI